MKKILVILLALFCINAIASDTSDSNYDDSDLPRLKSKLSDSLLSIIDRKPMILYMSGHRAHIWSVIIKNDSNYEIMCGRIDPDGVNNLYEPEGPNRIDTTGFLYANRDVISWGFDSLQIQSKKMQTVDTGNYDIFSRTLSTVKNDSMVTAFRVEKFVYAGPDSVNFNKKLNQLSYLMYWLAQPPIREYTTDSVFYIRKTVK